MRVEARSAARWAGFMGILVWSNTGEAQEAQDEEQENETPVVQEVVVRGDPLERKVHGDALLDGAHSSTGDVLDEQPGVSAARRGAAGAEPFLRGWGSERVMTQVGPLPVMGACPGVMDPPVSYLRPGAVRRLRLSMTLPSVADGPWGTGGRIVASTDPGDSPERLTTTLGGSFDSARLGGAGFMELAGGTDAVVVRGSLEGMKYGDYTSPSGTDVPAEQTELDGSFSVGFPGSGAASGWLSAQYTRHQNVSYPALPMDLRKTDGVLADGHYRLALDGAAASRLDLSGGVQVLEHVMDNAERPNRAMLEARTESQVRTGGLSAKVTSELSREQRLVWGVDGLFVSRDATRQRRMVASELTFEDHIWPEALQGNGGGFAEWSADWGRHWSTRLGARADVTAMGIGGAEDASLGGTVREAYVRFYGEDAGDTSRVWGGGAANALVHWTGEDGWSAHAGVGISTRPGSITERYFAFAPAPGGFQVGNPALRGEKRGAAELGLRFFGDWLSARAGAHATRGADYVLQTTIGEQDVNGDGNVDRILGFRNVGAWLLGSELEVEPRFLRYFSLPTQFELLWGHNTTDDRPLPQIAPWDLTTSLRAEGGPDDSPWRMWGEFGVRVVGRQSRIDEDFPETDTDGFVVLRAELGTRVAQWVRAAVAVENLAGEEYSEHLTRLALQPVGDLTPNQPIPAMGRRVVVEIKSVF